MMISLVCSLVFLVTIAKIECQERYRYPQYDHVYQQYQYKPYSYDLYGPNNCNEDCNRRYYPQYAKYLLYFKGQWELRDDRAYKPTGDIFDLWNSYGNYSFSGKVKSSKPKKKQHCCWQFKKLPVRVALGIYPKDRKRIEYRQLTTDQRNSLHDALNTLKGVSNNGVYDYFVSRHNGWTAPYAHNGAAFLPWHREYLFRLENALYNAGYTGPGLPYWDNTYDQALPTPSDSAIWTDDYLGNNNGVVNTGFAKNWQTISGHCQSLGTTLTRHAATGSDGNCLLMNGFDIDYVYSKRCFRDIVCNNDCKFESDHSGIHSFVGGHMGDPTCAPGDPVFFLHHAFIDCIWEFFRKNHQESDIFKEYPNPANRDDIGAPGHAFDQPMLPFNPQLLNGHGIENFYQSYYTCQNLPKKCNSKFCPPPLLWCNKERCMAKVKEGGNCTGLPSNACYCKRGKPICKENVCWCPKLSPILPVVPIQPFVPAKLAPTL